MKYVYGRAQSRFIYKIVKLSCIEDIHLTFTKCTYLGTFIGVKMLNGVLNTAIIVGIRLKSEIYNL